MSNIEVFRIIDSNALNTIRSRRNFIQVSHYARMVPLENEVGSLVDVKVENSDNVLRGGHVDGATIERLILAPSTAFSPDRFAAS